MAKNNEIAEQMRAIFATNLNHYLDRSGKSQSDIASLLNVSSSTVSEWVSGKKYPRMDKIQIMADYFGILKSDLTEDKNNILTANGLSEAASLLSNLPSEKQHEAINFIRYLANQE